MACPLFVEAGVRARGAETDLLNDFGKKNKGERGAGGAGSGTRKGERSRGKHRDAGRGFTEGAEAAVY